MNRNEFVKLVKAYKQVKIVNSNDYHHITSLEGEFLFYIRANGKGKGFWVDIRDKNEVDNCFEMLQMFCD